MIYAEWKTEGKFENGFFSSWEEFFRETFNPDIEIITVLQKNFKKFEKSA